MEPAKAIFTFGKVTRSIIAKFVALADVIGSDDGSDDSFLRCPHCERSYGSTASYPELIKEYCLIRCPCGKVHLGYKPFNGFQ